jgi:hypothetical protein
MAFKGQPGKLFKNLRGFNTDELVKRWFPKDGKEI